MKSGSDAKYLLKSFIQAKGAKRARLGYKKSAISHMHNALEGGGIPVVCLSVCLCVCWASISSQVLAPSSLIFSGYVGVMYGIA